MIVVVADDFTGAAELGGIGLRYNLKVEVNTKVNLQSTADLLVIATDTRSMPKHEAILETERVMDEVAKLNPDLLFKKTDSVLRGYVAEELSVIMKRMGTSAALLLPANPHFGRTIIDGEYFINAQALHQTNFANDPEFPAGTSSVIGLLEGKGIDIHSQKHTDVLKTKGIIIGDTANADDLKAWAAAANNSMVLAGSAGFFTALLDKLVKPQVKEAVTAREFKQSMLIISGTAFKNSANAIKKLKQQGEPVSYMPTDIVRAESFEIKKYQAWSLEIAAYITTFGKAIIAIDPADTQGISDQASILRDKTAIVTSMVFKQTPVSELLIEGGSTASAVFKHLGILKMQPVQELAPGVVRMKVDNDPGLYITIKPGSYAWPAIIKQYTLY
jgi:D-threonate/D-erythronate kinase